MSMKKLFLVVSVLFLFNLFTQESQAMTEREKYTILKNTGTGMWITGAVSITAGGIMALIGSGMNTFDAVSSVSSSMSGTTSSYDSSSNTSGIGDNEANSTLQTAGLVTLGVGGALVITGVTLYLVYDKKLSNLDNFNYGFVPYILPDENGKLDMGGQFAFSYKF